MTPIISCVVPVYNDKLHLPRAVKSALEQRPDVDDCSTDGSRELALEIAREDRRIVAIPLLNSSGQAHARMAG